MRALTSKSCLTISCTQIRTETSEDDAIFVMVRKAGRSEQNENGFFKAKGKTEFHLTSYKLIPSEVSMPIERGSFFLLAVFYLLFYSKLHKYVVHNHVNIGDTLVFVIFPMCISTTNLHIMCFDFVLTKSKY